MPTQRLLWSVENSAGAWLPFPGGGASKGCEGAGREALYFFFPLEQVASIFLMFFSILRKLEKA